jgi:hypothetical protein
MICNYNKFNIELFRIFGFNKWLTFDNRKSTCLKIGGIVACWMHEKNTWKNVKSKLVVNNTFSRIKQVTRWSFPLVSVVCIESQQRYWVHFYKQNAYWAFFLLHEINMAPHVDVIQMMRSIICHHESNNCDSYTSSSHNTTCTKRELFNIIPHIITLIWKKMDVWMFWKVVEIQGHCKGG